MENYNQSSNREENRQSGTTPNQYSDQNRQDQPRREQDTREERTIDNDTRYSDDQRMGQGENDRNYNRGNEQRPSQYNSTEDMEDDDDDQMENSTRNDMDDLQEDDDDNNRSTF